MSRFRVSLPLLKGYFCLFLAFAILLPSSAAAQKKGRLAGKVIDILSKKPVKEALVAIQGTTLSTLTDEKGHFSFDLSEGKVSISVYHQEYFVSNYQDLEISKGRITTYECELVPGDPGHNIFFSMGGINVLESRELIPEEIETVHMISSAEIEHQLSTNLGDILDIIPGVERNAPPGLSKKTQVGLRGTADIVENQSLALAGTKIVLDDITLSNNANLQTGTGTATSVTSSTAGSGIDLRTIPADNIESVEVITGVPSVEYGDVTSGIVRVKTKSGRVPHRLKIKSNPDTKEGNINGGFMIGGTNITYNANTAYSQRDIRRDGDEYVRYGGQLSIRNELMDKRLKIMNKLYYTGVHDENDLDQDDPLSMEQKNRDKTFIYGHTVDYEAKDDLKLEWNANISYTKRDSYYQRLTGADTRIITDETEPGTYEGIFGAGSYLSRIWTKGEEWNFSAKSNLRWDFNLIDHDNSLLVGAEYTFDDNVGEGKIFDPLYPPGGATGRRPLSFDAVPALQTASLYIEDEIGGSFRMRPWNLNLGFRYEMYTPFKLHLDGIFNEKGVVESKNGTYLNPRVRFKYELADNSQVRLSWGKSSKMSPMTNIFQGPTYIDVIELNTTPPPDSVPLITTYVYNYDNSRLMGYQDEKFEGSFDQKIGPLGIILTGFYTSSSKMPRSQDSPVMIERYSWSDWPDPESAVPIDTIYTDNNAYYKNVGWYENYGLEFQLYTKRIEKLSTVFRVNGSLYRSRSGSDGIYMSSPRPNLALDRTIYPFYEYIDKERDKMVISYSADWLIKRLGMWVTFFVQHTALDRRKDAIDPNASATGYYDPIENRYISISSDLSTELGLDRTIDDEDIIWYSKPGDRFLFNINVTKSVGRSAEISMFVHNVFDDAAYFLNRQESMEARNHRIFYGVEFSMMLNDLFRKF
ncbi:MAG: TonB-dependent receptor plug domain-containing protein [Candidatus Krumholzibacteriota bacterium]|nr:TonB-dependent receptor plug domain-containing protein [Candidatus Krumholzibacteriota bacterium]